MFARLLLSIGTPCALAALLALAPARASAQTVGLLREVWEGIGGGSVADLTSSVDYPSRPTSSNYVTDFFEAPTDVLENYGQRMHGYVVPPLTGNYTFWIASDDGGALFLSTDESPAKAQVIARVDGWTPSREWTREPNQQSAPVSLTAGKVYYISALMKEGGGGDNLAVRWLMPNGVDQAPIVGTNLLPFGIAFTPPVIARQPLPATAVEGTTASFDVVLGTTGPASYQWRRNGTDLPGAHLPALLLDPVRLTDHNARFSVLVTNRLGSVVSTEATLTVTPDRVPPTLASILNVGTTLLRLTFSEEVSTASALNAANYSISPDVAVLSVRAGATPAIVELTTAPLAYGSPYTLRVSNVQDAAQTPNTIAAGSSLAFTPVEYSPATIGTPSLNGSSAPVAGGVDLTGAGDIGGRTDAFQFAYQPVTGNFDRRVRVEAFTPTDPFARAGLMARVSLDAGAPFAAALTTPAQLGSFFAARTSANADASRTGSHPPSFPNTWLRLARAGNTFRGFASLDGQAWTELGSVDLAAPATVFLGFAVGSREEGVAAVARFRDAGAVAGATLVPAPARRGETPGPSTRSTPLAISEIHYHPRERADGRNTEFVEIHNADLVDRDLTGWRLSGSVDFAFPDGYRIPAGGYVVIARQPADLAALHGLTGVLGPFASTNGLPNNVGIVRLRDARDAIRVEVNYSHDAPWPVAADGAGPSLVLTRPSYGEDDPRAWAPSELAGGSPGTAEPLLPNPQSDVLINEILAHTDLPQLDAVELYNHSNRTIDLGGCVLTDDASTNRFRIPTGTVLTPRGFLAFDEQQLGFRLDAAGETLFLLSSNLTRVLDAVRFGPQENGVSSGRYPDGTPEWRRLSRVTLAGENAPFRVADVVIHEIMYNPISGEDDDEFVEIHNRSASEKDLGGWSFSDGIDFRFPAGTRIPGGGYFVVTRNRDRFLGRYPGLSPALVFGNYQGTLSNGGERLALAMPDFIVSTNELGLTLTNRIDIEIDEVTYGTGGAWGQWSDGLGSSLELVTPHSDHLRPSNWADSDESTKAPWTSIEFTGRVDNSADGVTVQRIHLLAQGPGEYLLDDVEVVPAGSPNRLTNGNFSGGMSGWTAQGNHRASTVVEGAGVNGSAALRIVTPGRGDTAVNRVRGSFSPALAVNSTVTLRAKVRWMRGWPEFLVRLIGNGLEAHGRLQLPTNLGTPGAPNSRALPNTGPALVDVRHTPVVPRANQPVVVTVRPTDPDGLDTILLRHRIDPAGTTGTVTLRDDGTGGDAVAGDGVFSGTLPGRPANTLVAFRIEATDRAAVPATTRFPSDAPAREALVRWGEEPEFGNVGVYRFWQRQSDFNRLRSREPLANDNVDCTFVYGDERVIYTAGMRGKGSPWHGGSVGGDYLFAMPEDDRLLGAVDVAIVTLGNLGSDPSAQREQAAFWIGERLGIAALHRRHVRFFENGAPKGLYEDTEEPNGRFVDQRFPEGPDGELFKIEDWFEFNDTGNQFVFSRDATLQRFTTVDGSLKQARYRWAWRKRAVTESANDYAAFLDLVQTLNAAPTSATYAARVEAIVDVDDWMRNFALQHIVGNWDAWGYNRGKNAYLYRPSGGRWVTMPWDIDFVLGSGSDGPTTDVFGTVDPTLSLLWNTPAFLRLYWRAFQDAINGPLRESEFLPLLEARRSALLANGFTSLEAVSGTRTYINQRRTYLAGRLASVDVPTLDITSNNGANFSTNRNVATLSGRAPIAVHTLEVNGLPFPVTWNTVNTWTLSVPLASATNVLQLVGRDRRGQPVPGATDSITIRYTGSPARPEDFVVINEIQYDPPSAGAAFVEIHNTSATGTFDLSGWRLDGASFEFPSGTLLRPGGFAVVAADLNAFRTAYGSSVLPVGAFAGNLQNNGERLRLVRPGATPETDTVIDEVRFDSVAPWPTSPRGLGPSLQLLDPRQDNRRPANWGAASTNSATLATPGTANSLLTTLEPFPDLWINEVLPANTDGLTDAAGDRDPWIEIHNAGTHTVDLAGLSLATSYANLQGWAFPAGTTLGPGQFLLVWADGEPEESTPSQWHASFRLSPTNGSLALVRIQAGAPAVIDHVDYRNLPANRAWGSFPDGNPFSRQLLHLPTPGHPNDNGAPAVQVVLNEWMASNGGAVVDPADGDADDWFELHNAGPTAADLSAYTLTDDLTRPDKYRIPNGTVLAPGGFLLVWADNETGQTTHTQLHASFQLAGTGESIGLFAPNGLPVDTLTFGSQASNVSEGRFPDAGAPPFLALDVPSPAAPNVVGTANRPPQLAGLGSFTLDEGGTVAFTATATDPDAGQTLRYSLLGAPDGASIDPVSGRFSWTTSEADGPVSLTFSVVATDNGTPPRSDLEPVTVTVREVNQAPVLDPIADLSADEGTPVTLILAGSDPDQPAQKLTYTLEPGAPAGMTLHPATGSLLWIPTEDQGPGVHTVTVRLTDDGSPAASATRSFRITVREVDDPPVFESVGLQTVDERTPFAITLVARDPDTPPRAVVYSLETAPRGATLDPDTGRFTWTPGEEDGPSGYLVLVRASQKGGGPSSTLSFSINVNEANTAPTLADIPNAVVDEGTSYAHTASAADADLPIQTLTYSLEPGAPAGLSIHPLTGRLAWDIPGDAGPSTNTVTVRVADSGIDSRSATRTFTLVVRARVRLVLNEIMHTPSAPRTEFVELLNLSSVTPWDLTGWRLAGAFTLPFAPGTRIAPGQHLVIARDPSAFRATHGPAATVVGPAVTALDGDGPHVLRLERPGDGGAWETIDSVAFHRSAPWPAAANQGGASLQLIDATRDNRRVANWAARTGATTNPPVTVVSLTNAWRYKQDGPAPADWRSPGFNDTTWPSGRALLVVEDATLAAPKNTQLTRTDGRFTYYFRTRFDFSGNPDGASLVINAFVDDGFALHLNGREIFRLGLDPNAALTDTLAANRTVADAALEGPFTLPVTNLVTGENVLAVEVHQVNATSSDIVWGARVDVLELKRDPATPGYANSVRASLPAFPDVWINEIQPRNTSGPADNVGDRDPWIELAQTGASTASLDGLWLSDDPSQLRKWALPTGSTLEPTELRLVWADAEPAEHTALAWHASFRPPLPGGLVLLSGQIDGAPAVFDYLRYASATDDQSFGSRIDSDPTDRGPLAAATPGAANTTPPPNRPPTLEPIADTGAVAFEPFQVDLRATDPDAGQRLTFELLSAPPGASIDPSTGRISWTPETLQVGRHAFQVRVIDNGFPPLDARQSFVVTVAPSPHDEIRITSIERTPTGELRLTCATPAGLRYVLERTDRLPDGTWTRVGVPASTSTPTMTFIVLPSAQPGTASFFRVSRVPP